MGEKIEFWEKKFRDRSERWDLQKGLLVSEAIIGRRFLEIEAIIGRRFLMNEVSFWDMFFVDQRELQEKDFGEQGEPNDS